MTDQVTARRPDPLVTDDNAFFWEGAERGELMCQQCGDCGHFMHPPRPMCPECNGMNQREVPLSGRGSVYTFCMPHYPQLPSFDYPLITALIDLEEGVRLLSNVVDIEVESVVPGMAVEVVFAPTEGGKAVPVFRPRQNTGGRSG